MTQRYTTPRPFRSLGLWWNCVVGVSLLGTACEARSGVGDPLLVPPSFMVQSTNTHPTTAFPDITFYTNLSSPENYYFMWYLQTCYGSLDDCSSPSQAGEPTLFAEGPGIDSIQITSDPNATLYFVSVKWRDNHAPDYTVGTDTRRNFGIAYGATGGTDVGGACNTTSQYPFAQYDSTGTLRWIRKNWCTGAIQVCPSPGMTACGATTSSSGVSFDIGRQRWPGGLVKDEIPPSVA